ncbi:DMT family transporter [Pseudoneobacillus sp. C159]
MNAQKFFTHPLGIVLSATGSTFLWGSAFPFIKLSYKSLDIRPEEIGEQMIFAGYRFFLAGLMILLFFTLLKRNMMFQKQTLWPVMKIGLFQTFFQYVLFYIGLSYSTGIQGSIIAGTTSFFQILLAHFMYKNDRLNMVKTVGIFLGFAGVIFANLPKGELQIDFGWGEVLLILAMLSGALGNILARNGSAKMEVGYLTAYQMVFGALGLLVVGSFSSKLFPFHFNAPAVWMLLYLAFLSAAGFILWNNVMKYNQVGLVSMYMFLVPVFGVILSSFLLGEQVYFLVMVGLALVVSGIVIVNRPKRAKVDVEMEQTM